MALIALASVIATLSGCHRAEGLDLVNGCEQPLYVFGGVSEPSAAATTNMWLLEPHATASTYFLDERAAVFYVRFASEEDWRGPLSVTGATAVHKAFTFEVKDEWCESDT